MAMDLWSVISNVTSAAGLIISCITLWQAVSAKRAAKEARNEVSRTLSMVNVAKFNMMIPEIRQYLYANKLEIANLRMRELKGMMIELKQMPKFNSSEELRKELSGYKMSMNVDIRNIEAELNYARKELQMDVVCENLEKLSDFLTRNEAQLKYN